MVRRDVIRLVTPGTLTEDSLLEARQNNYLAALARVKGDDDTGARLGRYFVGRIRRHAERQPIGSPAELARLEPSEIICPKRCLPMPRLREPAQDAASVITPLPASRFDSLAAERRLKDHFARRFARRLRQPSAAPRSPPLAALIDYVVLTQVGRAPLLRPPRREEPNAAMLIDAATRANLELTRTLAARSAAACSMRST